jgi:hypothetical protein
VKWTLVALLGACGNAGRELPMHVVVTDHTVAAYLDAADILPCSCHPFVFPAVGACSTSTDANPCEGNPYCPSCVTDFGVELNGQQLTPTVTTGNDPWGGYYAPFAAGALELVIAGCGHPATRIPLDGAAFPSATATADYVGGTAHASWTTDATSQQALVSIYTGYTGHLCFVSGASDYTFTGYSYGTAVNVQPLAAPTELDTDVGHVTIWRAGDASADLPTP